MTDDMKRHIHVLRLGNKGQIKFHVNAETGQPIGFWFHDYVNKIVLPCRENPVQAMIDFVTENFPEHAEKCGVMARAIHHNDVPDDSFWVEFTDDRLEQRAFHGLRDDLPEDTKQLIKDLWAHCCDIETQANELIDHERDVRAPRSHARHPYAQPGDHPDRVFLLRFDDADMRDQIFANDDSEEQALAAYTRYKPSWNVYLFAALRQEDLMS